MKYTANPIEVTAYRIESVGPALYNGGRELVLRDPAEDHIDISPQKWFWPVVATADQLAAGVGCPKEGDFYVIQSDGSASFTSKDVFERQYSPAKGSWGVPVGWPISKT